MCVRVECGIRADLTQQAWPDRDPQDMAPGGAGREAGFPGSVFRSGDSGLRDPPPWGKEGTETGQASSGRGTKKDSSEEAVWAGPEDGDTETGTRGVTEGPLFPP